MNFPGALRTVTIPVGRRLRRTTRGRLFAVVSRSGLDGDQPAQVVGDVTLRRRARGHAEARGWGSTGVAWSQCHASP